MLFEAFNNPKRAKFLMHVAFDRSVSAAYVIFLLVTQSVTASHAKKDYHV